jgi:hypothetical protein
MWDDCDYDADELDADRRLSIADRLLCEVKADADELADALELSEAVRTIRRVRARLARKAGASVA